MKILTFAVTFAILLHSVAATTAPSLPKAVPSNVKEDVLKTASFEVVKNTTLSYAATAPSLPKTVPSNVKRDVLKTASFGVVKNTTLNYAATAPSQIKQVPHYAEGEILKTSSFDVVRGAILNYANQNTVAIFDRNVLSAEKDSCFADKNGLSKIESFLSDIYEISPELYGKLLRFMWQSKKQSLVAPDMTKLFSSIRDDKKAVPIVIDDKYDGRCDNSTLSKLILEDLSALGYSLSENWPSDACFLFGMEPDVCSFNRGLICSGDCGKGSALKMLFQMNFLPQHKIVFIGCEDEDLNDVKEKFGTSNILLIQYIGVNDIIPEYKFSEVLMKYKIGCLMLSNIWKSDADAYAEMWGYHMAKSADEIFKSQLVEEKVRVVLKNFFEDKKSKDLAKKLLSNEPSMEELLQEILKTLHKYKELRGFIKKLLADMDEKDK